MVSVNSQQNKQEDPLDRIIKLTTLGTNVAGMVGQMNRPSSIDVSQQSQAPKPISISDNDPITRRLQRYGSIA